MAGMTHDELRELTGGYALGVLSLPERRELESHLATCPACDREVRNLVAVANVLAYAVPQQDPPAALRERVLRAAVGSSETRHVFGLKPRASWSLPVWLSAAATIAAVALGLYTLTLRDRIEVLEERLREANARIVDADQQVAVLRVRADDEQQKAAILAASDVRRIDLAGQPSAPGASGRAFWSPSLGPRLVFTAANLPRPEVGRQYQLWVIPPGGSPANAVSAGMLELDPNGHVQMLATPTSPTQVGMVAVSVEPAGGVPSPTGPIVLAGAL